MTKRKWKNYKIMMAILLSSVWFGGCSKHKVIKPPEHNTLDGMQEEYEHIPKPVSNIKPSIHEQDRSFDKYVKNSFVDVDAYKHKISLKLQGKRYGKNKISQKNTTDPQKRTSETKRLYPEIKHKDKVKHPIYKEMRQ